MSTISSSTEYIGLSKWASLTNSNSANKKSLNQNSNFQYTWALFYFRSLGKPKLQIWVQNTVMRHNWLHLNVLTTMSHSFLEWSRQSVIRTIWSKHMLFIIENSNFIIVHRQAIGILEYKQLMLHHMTLKK